LSEVSAVVMINLDQSTRALTDVVRPRQPWGHRSVFISLALQLLLRARIHSLQSKRLSYSSLVIFFSRPCRVRVNKGRCVEIVTTSLVTCYMKLLLGQGARCPSTHAILLENYKKDAWKSNGFVPPGPLGNRRRISAIPARPSGAAPEGQAWGPRVLRFTKPVELKKRRSARFPRVAVAALVQHRPPNPPPRPAGGSHCLGYHLGWAANWWSLVGGSSNRGHRKPGRWANCAC
jgi:hypothetical protein